MRLLLLAAGMMTMASAALAAYAPATQSTVMSLNYENLLLFIAVKVLVVLLWAGWSTGPDIGRAMMTGGEWSWGDQDDLLFLTAFLASNDLQGYKCVSHIACLRPARGKQLATVASFLIPLEGGWLGQVQKVREQLEEGLRVDIHGSCRSHYPCPQLSGN